MKRRQFTYFIFTIFLSGIINLFGEPGKIREMSPRRIISLAPHITEIIFKLGAGNRLVGRTDFCKYPLATKNVPSLGGYLNTDYEKLVSLKPDLILQFPNSGNRKKLEALGLTVEEIPNETIDEILAGILKIGVLLGMPERANLLKNNILDTLNRCSQFAGHSLGRKSAVLLVGRTAGTLEKLYAAGKYSYLSQLWERCGGRNAFNDVAQKYFSLNKENLISRQVDVILEFRAETNWPMSKIQAEEKLWQFFSNLKAVKNSQIYLFTDPMFLVPGPRISKIAVKFHEILKRK